MLGGRLNIYQNYIKKTGGFMLRVVKGFKVGWVVVNEFNITIEFFNTKKEALIYIDIFNMKG